MRRIFVNRNAAHHNRRNNDNLPAIVVEDEGVRQNVHRIDILDKNGNVVASIMQTLEQVGPDQPVVWIEADDIKVTP